MYNYESLLCTKYMFSLITSKVITCVQVYKHFIWVSDYILTRGSWATELIWATSSTFTGNGASHHLQGLKIYKDNACEIQVKWISC